MERSILHLDLDTFFVSVERLKDSRLEGKPLIVGGTGNRGVVSSCSYEARRFGVHAAMPTRMARKLCPHGIFLKGDFEAYQQHSSIVTEIIAEESPLYEKASVDEFYVDLTGMERFWGCRKWASEIRKKIDKETGLPLSLGLSVNKLVAKIATGEAKPNGEQEISQKEVLPFLSPMSVRKIPMIGKQTALDLAYMGVRRVKTLQGIPQPLLIKAFGKQGSQLYHRARGEDDAAVVPHREQKSISSEQTFSTDTIDIHQLKAVLTRITEKLAFKLRTSGRMTACIRVKIRYTDFETISRQATLPYTASDEVLIEKVLQLFDKLYVKRMRLRLVGVTFTRLVPGHQQIQLFQSLPKQHELYQALDQIRTRFGDHTIHRASGLGKIGR